LRQRTESAPRDGRGGVLDEGPNDVVRDEQIGEKGQGNQEEMKECLTAEFKGGGRHGWILPRINA
jgi:hypothetical protein